MSNEDRMNKLIAQKQANFSDAATFNCCQQNFRYITIVISLTHFALQIRITSNRGLFSSYDFKDSVNGCTSYTTCISYSVSNKFSNCTQYSWACVVSICNELIFTMTTLNSSLCRLVPFSSVHHVENRKNYVELEEVCFQNFGWMIGHKWIDKSHYKRLGQCMTFLVLNFEWEFIFPNCSVNERDKTACFFLNPLSHYVLTICKVTRTLCTDEL